MNNVDSFSLAGNDDAFAFAGLADGIQRAPQASSSEDAERVSELINSSWVTQAIHAAIDLGLFDRLNEEPASAAQLAAQIGCSAGATHRLLRALSSLDLCSECDTGVYELTSMGTLLAGNEPGSLQPWARLWCSNLADLWKDLAHSVREGKSVRALRGIKPGFSHLECDAANAELFNQAMVANSYWVAKAFARAADLQNVNSLIDVGGGHGGLLAAILHAHPEMRGVVFDLPHAGEGAGTYLKLEGLGERARFTSGDFFSSVPPGADAYVLKSVLHNWDDDRSIAILRQCRAAIKPSARLFIVERMMPRTLTASRADRAVARSDLNMLVALDASERGAEEYEWLLGQAGFAVQQTFPLAMGVSAIEARPC
jgi:orsellinic acid C2-O-methyltransferase